MKVADFDYQLPEHLIAQFPTEKRSDSRLLKVLAGRELEDAVFADICSELKHGDLLVLNDTKVIPARFYGHKDTGGKIEVLLERVLSESRFLAQIKSSKSPKQGQTLIAERDSKAQMTVIGRQGTFFEVEIQLQGSLFDWFEAIGELPLPPYIDRSVQLEDQDRYQTVFADQHGAVAAPTAGLHYDQNLLAAIRARGVEITTVTLHVGAGTYQPVRSENVEEHKMHKEFIEVDLQVCDAILACKQRGGRVIAVGTTVIRSLETAAQAATSLASAPLITPFSGDTDIFIYPGFEFKVVDLLQTNFHLPQSTLMMLVSAFAGTERIQAAYKHAIEQQYRFFSYGDAMLLERA